MNKKPSYLNFNKEAYSWSNKINYRDNPSEYKVGKGEQGVLICEPYKGEILPLWRFKTPVVAKKSSGAIYQLALYYLYNDDFVGADMARKFLQMGFTRARRYANYKGGRKYDKNDNYKLLEKGTGDPEKEMSAEFFYKKWKKIESNSLYAQMKVFWKKNYG